MSAPTHVTQSLEDKKKSREMAQARQSGSAPPEMDVKTGSMINPHNPEFITKRPWYLGGNDEGPSLDHQATQKAASEQAEFSLSAAERLVQKQRDKLKRAQQEGKIRVGMWVEAFKHGRKPYRICQVVRVSKKKNEYDLRYEDGTVEKRVRASKIKLTKTGSRSYAVDQETYGKETYDSKRDAYHGYEITEAHAKRMEERYEQREALRREARKKEQAQDDNGDKETTTTEKNRISDSDADSDLDDSDVGSDSDDEFVQRDEDAKTFTSRLARQGGVGGAQMKVTARNLRIREDTAKYLRNLNPNSAYYDPKSRSMRDNPNPDVPTEELQFAGDNFARISGDAVDMAETQTFAWDAQDRNVDVHVQANPSQAELLKKQYKSKSANLKAKQKQAVLDKYGGAEYLDGRDGLASAIEEKEEEKEKHKVRFGVSVQAEEYTRDGRQIKCGVGAGTSKQRVALESKYQENVYTNGHTAVWGSYFHRGAFSWGYADDHSLIRNSYGTGANGRVANDEANELRYGTGVAGSAALAQARQMLKAIPANERSAGGSRPLTNNSELYGEATEKNPNLDQAKVKEALQKLKDKKDDSEQPDRKRKYNSLNSDDINVTEEEMEAYRLQKGRSDDPMAKVSSDDVLEYQ